MLGKYFPIISGFLVQESTIVLIFKVRGFEGGSFHDKFKQ